jgi:hypothetical protein
MVAQTGYSSYPQYYPKSFQKPKPLPGPCRSLSQGCLRKGQTPRRITPWIVHRQLVLHVAFSRIAPHYLHYGELRPKRPLVTCKPPTYPQTRLERSCNNYKPRIVQPWCMQPPASKRCANLTKHED